MTIRIFFTAGSCLPFLFLQLFNLLDDVCRRAAGDHLDELDAAAVALDDLGLGQRLERVVAALDVDVGADLGDDGLGRLLAEQHDVVDGLERADDLGAVELAVDGARGALVAAHGRIRVEAEHEAVAEGARLLEVAHMAGVQDVEAAVREDDLLPGAVQDLTESLDIIGVNQHGISSL